HHEHGLADAPQSRHFRRLFEPKHDGPPWVERLCCTYADDRSGFYDEHHSELLSVRLGRNPGLQLHLRLERMAGLGIDQYREWLYCSHRVGHRENERLVFQLRLAEHREAPRDVPGSRPHVRPRPHLGKWLIAKYLH